MEVHGHGMKVDGVGMGLVQNGYGAGVLLWSVHPADQAPGSSKKVREETASSGFTYLQACLLGFSVGQLPSPWVVPGLHKGQAVLPDP